MKPFEIRNSWEDLKQRLKHNFKHLNDYDLEYREGKEEEFVKSLMSKFGNDRKDMIEILNRIQLY